MTPPRRPRRSRKSANKSSTSRDRASAKPKVSRFDSRRRESRDDRASAKSKVSRLDNNRREDSRGDRLATVLIVYGLGLGTAVLVPGLAFLWLILGCFFGVVWPWFKRQSWGQGVVTLWEDLGSKRNLQVPWPRFPGWFWVLLGIVGFVASIYLQVRSPRPAATDISHVARQTQVQNADNTQTIITLVRGQVRSTPRENRSGKARFWLDATQVSQVFEETRNLGGDGEFGISAESPNISEGEAAPETRAPAQLPLDDRSRGVTGKLYVTVPLLQATGLQPDQWVQVTGRLYVPQSPKNPGAFNFQAYLAREGAFAGLSGDRLERLDQSGQGEVLGEAIAPPGLGAWLAQLRRTLVQRSVAAAGYPEGVVMAAMMMGRRTVDFPVDLQDAFSRGGMAHVLATSGFHVSVLLAMVQWPVGRLRKSWRSSLRIGLGAIVLVGLVALSGGTPSVWRAALMGIPVLLMKESDQRTQPVGLLLVVAAVLLLVNPLWIQNLSFQLSFVATFGVLVSAGPIERGLEPILTAIVPPIGKLVAGWIGVAVAATIWILPLQIFYFAQVSSYSIGVNV
ncbi:MAG: ComEC/Rec2 family competence protein, partial [Cyanobacteria bacterium P01_H01_bin.130]